MSCGHGISICGARMHPGTQQGLEEVHVQRLCFPFLLILHVIPVMSVKMREGFHTISGKGLDSPPGTSRKNDQCSSVEVNIRVGPPLTLAPGAFMVLRSTL